MSTSVRPRPVGGTANAGAASAGGSAGWPGSEAGRSLRPAGGRGPGRPRTRSRPVLHAERRGTGWGGESGRPHLGRAFSVCRTRDGRLEFLLEAIGPGTERLAELEEGDGLWLVGPLGIGFTQPPAGSRALLVGGGIGIAPLVIWAEALRRARACRCWAFAAASTRRPPACFPGHVLVATDDGTGPNAHHGLVTDLLERELAATDVVYACGPHPMLEAVRRICVARGVEAQLALEAGMACGFGACFGCVVATRTGFRRLCVDGPVVRAAELAEDWH